MKVILKIKTVSVDGKTVMGEVLSEGIRRTKKNSDVP